MADIQMAMDTTTMDQHNMDDDDEDLEAGGKGFDDEQIDTDGEELDTDGKKKQHGKIRCRNRRRNRSRRRSRD